MTIQLIPEWAIVVEEGKALGLLIAALAIGILVEIRQGHIARPAIAVNAILLWQLFFDTWSTLPIAMHWYLNIGLIIGALALISYIRKFSLPDLFYKISYLAYGSLSVLIVVAALFLPWSPFA